MFRILIADDNPADVFALQEGLRSLRSPCQIDCVQDGGDALDVMYRRRNYTDAARPDLVVLDLDMPRVSGLEVLLTLKADPEMRLIPVIIYSASTGSHDVQSSYLAHANAFVGKPSSQKEMEQFVRSIELFWMGRAILAEGMTNHAALAAPPIRMPANSDLAAHAGGAIAGDMVEAQGQAMRRYAPDESRAQTVPYGAGCDEYRRLLDDFGDAVHELFGIHQEQFQAIVAGDGDSHRFDLLIHMANEKKQSAKYAYLRHVESHGCANADAINQTRTRSNQR